jgi:hypothetical protein
MQGEQGMRITSDLKEAYDQALKQMTDPYIREQVRASYPRAPRQKAGIDAMLADYKRLMRERDKSRHKPAEGGEEPGAKQEPPRQTHDSE